MLLWNPLYCYFKCTFFCFYFFKKMQHGTFIRYFVTGPCSLHISLELKILGDFLFVWKFRLFCLILPQTKLCFKWQVEFVKTNIRIIFRWRKTPGRKTNSFIWDLSTHSVSWKVPYEGKQTPSYGTFQETECVEFGDFRHSVFLC